MTKILIIEDNPYKREKIKKVLSGITNNTSQIMEAHSFTSGWNAVNESSYDLICLDMSLPTFDQDGQNSGGESRVFGGKEIARKMKRRKIQSKFVVMTQYKRLSDEKSSETFDEIRNELLENYPVQCLEVLFYSNKHRDWAEKLESIIKDKIL